MTGRPIVAGTDDSEESMQAVEWAAREAVRRKVPLRIVSVPAMPPRTRAYGYPEGWDVSPSAVADLLCGEARQALTAAAGRAAHAAPGLLAEMTLLSGPPARALAGAGSGASMLAVGARGAGGFMSMVLGSVSRYVAMHAPCPVTVVRGETAVRHREIAVGVRDPEKAAGALGFAFKEAAMRGARLLVVHASPWDPQALPASWAPPASYAAGPERAARRAGRAGAPPAPQRSAGGWRGGPVSVAGKLTDVLARWRDKYPEVPVSPDIVHGHPGRVLASLSARADLVVLGRDGEPEAGGPAVGATQHAVLSHARGPVAIVPASCWKGPAKPG